MESHARSIVKAISWRIIAGFITTAIAWIITGEIAFAAAIGITDTIIKLGAYYYHERIWNHVKFGRVKPPEYEI